MNSGDALSALREALAVAATGDWVRAHEIVQDEASLEAAWVHAYLHRQEGDLQNARYWYRRAGRGEATGDLETERLVIAREIGSGDQG